MVACYGCWMHAASSEYLDSSFVCLCCHTADDEKCIHLSINAHDKEGSRTYTKNWDKAHRCNFSYDAFISDLLSIMLPDKQKWDFKIGWTHILLYTRFPNKLCKEIQQKSVIYERQKTSKNLFTFALSNTDLFNLTSFLTKNSLGFSLKLVGTPLVVSARFLVHFSRSA